MKVRRALSLGIGAGLVLFGALFLAGTLSLIELAGEPDPDTQRMIDLFGIKIYLTLARVGLVHLWIGLVLGGVCGVLLRLLYPSLATRRWLFALACLVVLTLGSSYFTIRLLIRQPTFFDQFLQAQGGWMRHWQIQLTDHMRPVMLDLTAGALLLVLLLSSKNFRGLVPRGWPRDRGQRVFALVWGVVVLSLSLRYLWSPPRPVVPERPNILVVAVDSLRPDHLSFEGYHRDTTPHLDRLAANSRVFRNAYVSHARTLPSWSTFLTGTEPQTHGVRHMFPDSNRRRLAVTTLPEVLREHGYRSGVVSDFAGEMFDLMDYGFDLVDTPPASDIDVLVERQIILNFPLMFAFVNHRLGKRVLPVISYLTINSDATKLANRALRRMRELADDGPFFLTVFFSTCHAPYASPAPYYRRYADPDYEGLHRYAYGVRDPRDLMSGTPEYSDADKEQIIALYDGALASVDAAIGDMLAELERWDFRNSTLILVTADHGEHLFEAGNDLDHGKWFRGGDCANHIPLIVHDPTGELGTGPVEELMRNRDIMPTLLGRLGIAVPPTCEGVDLFPFLRDQEPLPDLSLFAETGVWLKAPTTFAAEPRAVIYPPINEMLDADEVDNTLILAEPYDERVVEAKHRMLRRGPWKLVYEPTLDGFHCRLYDVRRDPLNQEDLAETYPELVAELYTELETWMQGDRYRRLDPTGHRVPLITEGSP